MVYYLIVYTVLLVEFPKKKNVGPPPHQQNLDPPLVCINSFYLLTHNHVVRHTIFHAKFPASHLIPLSLSEVQASATEFRRQSPIVLVTYIRAALISTHYAPLAQL